MKKYKSTYISSATTTVVKSGIGVLRKIIVGTTSAGAIKIYDGVDDGAGIQKGELKASIAEGTFEFDCVMAKGILIITDGASKITVIYE